MKIIKLNSDRTYILRLLSYIFFFIKCLDYSPKLQLRLSSVGFNEEEKICWLQCCTKDVKFLFWAYEHVTLLFFISVEYFLFQQITFLLTYVATDQSIGPTPNELLTTIKCAAFLGVYDLLHVFYWK